MKQKAKKAIYELEAGHKKYSDEIKSIEKKTGFKEY